MPLPRNTQDMHTRHRTSSDVPDTEQLFYFPRIDPQSQSHQQQQQQQHGAGFGTSTQSLVRHRNNLSTFSLSSHITLPSRISTLEAYEFIYGDGASLDATAAETVERLYENDAGTYENPLMTASSRQIIGDINALTRQLRGLDVPRPLAMFRTLFRPSNAHVEASESWFRALQVWSEIDEIYDSESFDGHRLSIIEHTLNILILPDLHSHGRAGATEHAPPDIDSSSAVSLPSTAASAPMPVLAIPGLRRLPLPSPLHLKLHVISRLSFNEQGRITRHRDFWDVRDLLALVPGVRAAQWIGTRATAHALAWATRLVGWATGKRGESNDVESGPTPLTSPVSAYSQRIDSHGVNALGLHFNESGSGSSASKLVSSSRRPGPSGSRAGQAPDVDRDTE